MEQTTSVKHIKHKFTIEEDIKLKALVNELGTNNWNEIAKRMNDRTSRQCKERWTIFLNPQVKQDEWTPQEDQLLISKYFELGPKWKKISLSFNGRSDINVKNRHKVLERRAIRFQRKQLKQQILNSAIVLSKRNVTDKQSKTVKQPAISNFSEFQDDSISINDLFPPLDTSEFMLL